MGLIKNPITIGDHIKNQRLKLHQFQKDVAKIFDVSTDTITNWENNRGVPQIQYYPTLIKFLGYLPFEIDISTPAGKLKEYRFKLGISHKKMGKILGVDGSTISSWESGEHQIPKNKQLIIFAEN